MLKYEPIIEKCNPSQTHSELNELLTLLEKIKIKNVLEIGVHVGGSIRVWKEVFKPDLIMGIDWKIEPEARTTGVTLIGGKSQSQETYNEVIKTLNGDKLDFLFIDGSHYYNDVKSDFELYEPLVREGGAIAFHDVILTGNDTCEVYRYWNDIKDKYNSVTISHKAEFGPAATGTGLIWK
jgi:predicted O-methyltransferase YrrM